MDSEKEITLTNALELLKKVLSVGETTYTFEDWQMLQVAQFLVSKEKVLIRDNDNVTLHFANDLSFYYIDDLCERIYNLAKYIYSTCFLQGEQLIVDSTKRIDYLQEIPEKYKNAKNPTFEEALILVNMVRNSIAHSKTKIDFENSMLKIDNRMFKLDGSGDIQFRIKVDIPISFLSDIDYGQIMQNNTNKLLVAVFDAIKKGNYLVSDRSVQLIVESDGRTQGITVPTEVFMLFEYAYDKYVHRLPNKSVEEIDYDNFDKRRLRLIKEPRIGRQYINKAKLKPDLETICLQTLQKVLGIIDRDNTKCLDSKIVTQFLSIINSGNLSSETVVAAMDHFNAVLNSINFQQNTEDTLNSMSLALGIKKQQKSIDFIALYNFMTMLFSNYPLKEGNKILTEFIDFSDIDVMYTQDIDIVGFYRDVEKIIKEFIEAYTSDPVKYQYRKPCIDLYAKTIVSIFNKFKTRNNALIRHIRNSVDHSGVDLSQDSVILKDYVVDGDEVEKTFKARARILALAKASFDYYSMYNIEIFPDYWASICFITRAICSHAGHVFVESIVTDGRLAANALTLIISTNANADRIFTLNFIT